MKKLFILMLILTFGQTTKSQTYVTIPDANFVTWLQANISSAMSGNQMDISDLAVATRTNVNVNYQGIVDLTGIQYFTALKNLSCVSNSLTNLPPLPNSILEIDCSMNPLSQLPILPSSLSYLSCYNCQLTSLPSTFPASLIYFNCSNNSLAGLPVLPNSLVSLYCSSNQLTSLPLLPSSLLYVDCSNNQLTQLPVLPVTLSRINCSFNQLTSLPQLPFNLNVLNCSHNNISCFPLFPNSLQKYVQTTSIPDPGLDITFNPFTCLPNYVSAMDFTTLSTPLCVFSNTLNNPNGCTDYKSLTGIIFNDLNNDCVKSNMAEFGLKNAAAKLYDNSNLFLGSAFGNVITNYSFTVPMGAYKVSIDTTNKPYMSQCVNPGIDSLIILNIGQISEDSVNFPVVCKPGFDVGVQSIVTNGLVFPGQIHKLIVNAGDMGSWYNLHCSNGITGSVSFSVNGPVTYLGPAFGALTPIITGNIYTYNIVDFGTINNNSDFNLLFTTDVTAQVGDIICVSATVTPINGDNVTINNTYQFCYTVVNSYDPNIKEVYPVTVPQNYNNWLTYSIHFENTGNSSALNIRIKDVLDNKLNLETFEIINYSDNNKVELLGSNLLINFANINLAPNSSGFIQYRIKPKSNWLTDTIKNIASIYFDYNDVIVTNIAKTYFTTETSVVDFGTSDSEVILVPNPTDGYTEITSKYDILKIEVLNITNQLVLSEIVNNKNYLLQLQNYTEGIYFVKINHANGTSITKKIIRL